MKTKVCILFVTCIALNINAFSQIKFGLRAGLISSSINSNSFTTTDNNYRVQSLSNAKFGIQGGLMAQIALLGIFIQPEFLLSSTGGEIQIQDLKNQSLSTVSKQNFTNLTIPVLIGPKFGPLRIGIGPVANILLSKPSDAINFSPTSVSTKFHGATFDYQIGAGLDLWKLALDLKYQGNLSKLGNGMDIGGNTYKFDSRVSQWIFGVGWYF